MIETEAKIKVTDVNALKERLLGLGGVLERDRYLETNILYDYRGDALFAKREALRLRTIGKRAWLTFKGAPRKARSFKVRPEFESEVRDPASFRKVLKALGLRPVFRYRKHRTLLRKGRLAICLDETSVGDYLELEGRRSDIVRFARALGYSRTDFITQDYVAMIAAAAAAAKKG
ncbi:MAG TPA: class IV adenylate cyclase [Acidobacteriota bacterium]|nr:class IV adenylate cyclase [Acidobacteriota bacterium]